MYPLRQIHDQCKMEVFLTYGAMLSGMARLKIKIKLN